MKSAVLKIGMLRNTKVRERLIKKYHLEVKLETRCQQFRQNRQFNSNQRRFYQNLKEGNNYSTEIPDKEETSKFWKNIEKILNNTIPMQTGLNRLSQC